MMLLRKFVRVALLVMLVTVTIGCRQTEEDPRSATDHRRAKSHVDTMVRLERPSTDAAGVAAPHSDAHRTEALAEDNTTQSMSHTTPSTIDMTHARACTGATIVTNKGAIVVSFMNTDAPVTVANFCTLAARGFYNNVIFHRVIKGFMIQGGDPTGTGTGGPGYRFADEIHANNHNTVGTLSMANAGPNTNGSQFFINTADNVFLDGKHTVFGTVTSGMDVVRAIENVATDSADAPLEPVRIESVALQRSDTAR